MNKDLIYKLADQANQSYLACSYDDLDLVEFAKLIVNECVKICNHTGHDVSNGGRRIPESFYEKAEDDIGEVAWLCSSRIKEQFGVE